MLSSRHNMSSHYTTSLETAPGAATGAIADSFLWRQGPALMLGIITGTMTFLMIVGNVVVLTCLLLRSSVRSPSNMIIGATSLNDLLTALIYLIFVTVSCFTNTWFGGDDGVWCAFSATFSLISMKVTFVNISMVAVDRLLSIRFPLTYRRLCSTKKVIVFVALTWIVVYTSAILLISLLYHGPGFFSYSRHYKQCVIYWDATPQLDNSSSQIFSTFELAFNVSLFFVMLTCNWYVLYVVRQHVTHMNNQLECGSRTNINSNRSCLPSNRDFQLSNKPTKRTNNRSTQPRSRSIQSVKIPFGNQSSLSSNKVCESRNNLPSNLQSRSCKSFQESCNVHAVPRDKKGSMSGARKFTPVFLRALTTSTVVVTVFIVSWIPYYIVFILLIKMDASPPILAVYDISWWLTYLGPVVNPYLFAFRLQSFKSVIKEWLGCGAECNGYVSPRTNSR